MSSSPVPLNTRRVGQRFTLNLSKAETSFRWACLGTPGTRSSSSETIVVLILPGCRHRRAGSDKTTKEPEREWGFKTGISNRAELGAMVRVK
ncbi:hypothetical protein TNCV_3030381 [Trichonephila clavipes]|nr:hypothetical protein TNCV_3030381 [Trichonephila clavipes]